MSFILDALKKSENERQQQAPAEFVTVPSNPDAPRAPKWLWILGALLVVNIVVVVTLIARDDVIARQFLGSNRGSTAQPARKSHRRFAGRFGDRLACGFDRIRAVASRESDIVNGNQPRVVAKPRRAAPEWHR